MLLTKQLIQMKIEVEERRLVIVFNQKVESMILPWQGAMEFSYDLKTEAEKIPTRTEAISFLIQGELNQFKVGKTKNGCIAFDLENRDRIVLGYHAATCVSNEIFMMAEELRLIEQEKKK